MKKILIILFVIFTTVGICQEKEREKLSLKEFYSILKKGNSKYLKGDEVIYNEYGEIISYSETKKDLDTLFFFRNLDISIEKFGADSVYHPRWEFDGEKWVKRDPKVLIKNVFSQKDIKHKVVFIDCSIIGLRLENVEIPSLSFEQCFISNFQLNNCKLNRLYSRNNASSEKATNKLLNIYKPEFIPSLRIKNSTINEFSIGISEFSEIDLDSCNLRDVKCFQDFSNSDKTLFLSISNCHQKGELNLINNLNDYGNLIDFSNQRRIEIEIKNSRFKLKPGFNYLRVPNGSAKIKNVSFLIQNSNDTTYIGFGGNYENLNISNSEFQSPLLFEYNSIIENNFTVVKSQFKFVDFSNLTIPENQSKTYVKWRQLSEKLAVESRINREFSLFFPISQDSAIRKEIVFDQIKNTAYQFYNCYKTQGDLESANGCYAEIKEFETKRLGFLFKENPRFETYFRWKLNQFLNFFTDYGTNPAKAVIKSLWVILIFAAFYLFFPSDWDITNRAEFLNKWKALLSRKLKDESPKSPFAFYLSTVVFLLYTGMIHLLNALTLSLNAFTTLGFGDIPTHGAARYVTIVQGFIGWFLLTIFSVSLINQVLG